MTATIIVTMAGEGRRFRDAGFDLPKFAIPVHGRTLLDWSLYSLTRFAAARARVVFVARAADNAIGAIARACAATGFQDWSVVTVDGPTDGQATTVLRAEIAVADPQERLLVYNVDTLVWPGALDPAAFRGDGWIPCFPGAGEAWSFARADAAGRVAEVREKRRISADATVGLYGFANWQAFRAAYDATYGGGAPREAGECYVAPLYNAMIAAGADVRLSRLPASAVVPLGTPDDVARFAATVPVEPDFAPRRREAAA
ncbi:MAG: NTP transferase domain-containing protein [Alphaproteobacteria bacterium]